MAVTQKLFSHQQEAISFLSDRDRGALLMEMGTGKTRIVLEHIRRAKIQKTLVVVPKSLFFTWGDELSLYPDLSYTVLDGTRSKRERLSLEDTRVHLINYEYLSRFLDRLVQVGYEMVVFDESTMVKSSRAKRTKAAISLADRVQRVLILTGTPVANSPLDAWAQFRLIGPEVLGTNYWAFKEYHCIEGGFGCHEVIGYHDLEGLAERLAEYSFRKKKNECLDLPPKTITEIRPKMLTDQRRLYNQVKKELLWEIKEGEVHLATTLTKMLRLSQIVGGHLPLESGELLIFPSCKEEVLLSLIEEAGSGKVVVWVRFLHELRTVVELLKDYGVVSMCGATTDRESVVKQFRNDSNTRVLVCQVQVGKFGLTLVEASTAIYYSKSYSLEDYLQSQDRIHRIGQSSPVTIINLNAMGTIDVALQRALNQKKSLSEMITDHSITQLLDDPDSI